MMRQTSRDLHVIGQRSTFELIDTCRKKTSDETIGSTETVGPKSARPRS